MKTSVDILKPLVDSGVLDSKSQGYFDLIKTINTERLRQYNEAYDEAITDASKKVWNYSEKQGILDLKKKYSMS